ncbi:MAG: DEAD/DEAH box helicase [Candidatus Competibacteraceae bacterium]|uniref:DEAD-box ATP-dependent RNA helicase RhpA n=1 Tax=Candidatus Contendobacter odensis Run_B_J11 TaxID=1400861 RepID=A0A7U7GFL0_9GAMM|nr:DEAD/DEAH box helicase [Candidatus Contendobacter odensis]MBK8536567.1 DEAD/DEAH box helicase [Candidatus Competibacteraceae bacterium]MBK8753155.1 DEAD/DEAH box helicase [Candidatus Competibacteraceae bacterium]CDH47497.1 ATP-dependent RNA helicase rhlE [Candidatus Contendobacter odensis Run_B_J11]
MPFAILGLADDLVRAVAAQGYTTPTPIQAQAIPVILAGRDLLAAAQTGTGKTAAFTLPLLQRLDIRREGRLLPPGRPRALVVTPTRELAAQIVESVRVYGRHLAPRTALLVGGVSMKPQFDALRRGVDVLVATPGRLLDHISQKTVNLSNVEILVLDEADRMLDLGFLPAIRRLLALLPKRRQTLLFSATFAEPIRQLSGDFMNDPAVIDVAPRNAPADLVDQQVHPVDQDRKAALLSHLLSAGERDATLVFTRTKHGADRLSRQLERDGIRTAALHGNKSQSARTRALDDFKQGRIQVLVATDIAARGLDIVQLPRVVNYELPHVPEDYVHRIGRTGRAGCTGLAVSLVSEDETSRLHTIQRLLGRTLPSSVVEGFAPSPVRRSPTAPASAAPGARRHHPQRGSSSGERSGSSSSRRPAGSGGAAGDSSQRRTYHQTRRVTTAGGR